MNTDNVPPLDVQYEMRVAAHLRYDEVADRLDWPADVHDEQLNRFMDDETWAWNSRIEQLSDQADADEEFTFQAPNYLLDKLADVSASIRQLERFRDDLITFARTYAIDPESVRVIAGRTGLSHTTIVRTGNDEPRRRAVAHVCAQEASRTLNGLAARSDPELYGRLTAITTQTKESPRS